MGDWYGAGVGGIHGDGGDASGADGAVIVECNFRRRRNVAWCGEKADCEEQERRRCVCGLGSPPQLS